MSNHYSRWVLDSPTDIRQLDKIYGRLCRQRDSQLCSEVNSVPTAVDKLWRVTRSRVGPAASVLRRSLIRYFNNARYRVLRNFANVWCFDWFVTTSNKEEISRWPPPLHPPHTHPLEGVLWLEGEWNGDIVYLFMRASWRCVVCDSSEPGSQLLYAGGVFVCVWDERRCQLLTRLLRKRAGARKHARTFSQSAQYYRVLW